MFFGKVNKTFSASGYLYQFVAEHVNGTGGCCPSMEIFKIILGMLWTLSLEENRSIKEWCGGLMVLKVSCCIGIMRCNLQWLNFFFFLTVNILRFKSAVINLNLYRLCLNT